MRYRPSDAAAISVLVLFAVAVVAAERRLVEHNSAVVLQPRHWRPLTRALATDEVELIFALKQRNLDKLEERFYAVSDPSSSSYGRHLSLDEVNELVSPTAATVSAVSSFLVAEGVEFEQQNDFIVAAVSVATAERLLNAQYYEFAHVDDSSRRILRSARPYSLPTDVADHVDFVGGVTHFPQSTLLRQRALQKAPARLEKRWGLAVTPRVVRDTYNIDDAVGQQAKNTQCVVQFLEQYMNQADLDEFFALLLPSALGNVPKTIGPNNWGAGVEAALDIEYIMSTGEDIPTVFWSNGGLRKGQEPFLKWILAVNSDPTPPLVLSVSYGDDEPSLSAIFMTRINVEFQKAGLRGISILFASGDSGVGGSFDGKCKRFVPGFPATASAVTAVGGTDFEDLFETGPEIVNGLSGGGFSNVFAQTPYQAAAVAAYFKNMSAKLPPQSYWNRTGRGFPDIAALSSNFLVVVNLIPTPGVAGTSCATPVSAGIIALLNDLRLAAGKPPLGFLNPLLYQLGAQKSPALTDVVKGSNPGCGQAGFGATVGWDPSSGWGSLNYAEFAKIVTSF